MKIDIAHITKSIKQVWMWMLRKDAYIFLLFVGLATLFWWGRAMSSQRDIDVKLPVIYTDVPTEVVFYTPLPTHLKVSLRDNGRLLRQVQNTKPTVTINLAEQLKKNDGKIHLSPDVIRQKTQDILPGSTAIQHIQPEDINSTYYVEASKQVPIHLRAEWTLETQYQLSVSPVLEPAFVEIYGMPEALDTIDCIYTDSIFVDKVQGTVQHTLNLQQPSGVRTSTTTTLVTWISERFTDKSFSIPIEVEGLPVDNDMHVFPKTTTITARVGISHFAEVTETDFRAVCYYPTTNEQTLEVEIVCSSPYVTKMRSSIREVEYIIEQKP